jgi:hypothetical protein
MKTALAAMLLVLACTKPADRCGSSTDCTDPAYPFCDVEGQFPASGGTKDICTIAPPVDAGSKVPGTDASSAGPDAPLADCHSLPPSQVDPCTLTPSGPLAIHANSTFDTNAGTLTRDSDGASIPVVAKQVTGPTGMIEMLLVASLTVDAGVTLRAMGNDPIGVIAFGPIEIDGVIDVSSNGASSGAGAQTTTCGQHAGATPVGGNLSGGGGGGGNQGSGGAGGNATGTLGSSTGGAGGTGSVTPPMGPLGGCAGFAFSGLTPAAGGGAAYLAGTSVELAFGAGANAGGAGAVGATGGRSGGGGGAGGTIMIEAASVVVNGTLAANGGGGAQGSISGVAGGSGGDGQLNATPAPGGSGGNGTALGGAGGAGQTLAGSVGGGFGQNQAGGASGGGGGVGFIIIHGTLTGSGVFSPSPST